jgi:hypothetical protein
MIKTTFIYDEESLIAFFTFHLKRKDKIRWIYYLIASLFFIFGIIVAFVFNKQIFGLLILVASTIMFMVFPSQAKRAAKRTANARFKREPHDIIFTNERIEQHLEKKILAYNWDLVKEVYETKKYIYFYISNQGALIVNKDCITETEYLQLIELVKQKQKKYYIYK